MQQLRTRIGLVFIALVAALMPGVLTRPVQSAQTLEDPPVDTIPLCAPLLVQPTFGQYPATGGREDTSCSLRGTLEADPLHLKQLPTFPP